MNRHAQIGTLLVESELLTSSQLLKGLDEQRRRGGRLVRILINMGCFSATDFQRFLARHLRFASISLDNYQICPNAVQLLPREFALEHDVLAIDQFRSRLSLGMACPLDHQTIVRVEEKCGAKVNPFLCSFDDLAAAIQRQYRTNTMSYNDLVIPFSTGDKHSFRNRVLA